MQKVFITFLNLMLALAISPTFAQTFPVRVTPILQPPYTPFLSDYTDPGAEKLTLQIILNDLTVNEFRTKLRLTIEGVGITITTNPNYFPPPISLQGGVPQIVYGSDIADYFKSSNLVFQGLNPSELEKTGGKLPEGIYRMSFEVLDYNRNTVVSNKGSATAWMILNDPPIINLPVNNAKIKPINPQNIVFQWTPRHRGSPNAAFTTDYDLKLVEIWPAGRNPYDAINTSRPILETTTSSTLFVFGPDQTPLVLGREYALQIRARDTGGKDVFKNNGYSEVIRFVYGDECPMPTGSEADNISTAKGRLRWQGSGLNSRYQVRYREKKNEANWFEEQTERSYLNLSGLRAGTVYEYQMRGECNNFQSEYNGVKEFATLVDNPNGYACSDPNTIIAPDGSPPLRALFTNDSIHAGGFDVIVTSATGSNGIFTGEGLAEIPWFNSAKVRVTYQNIAVNTSYQLTAGDIKSVWDPNSRSMLINENNIDDEGNKSDSIAAEIKFFEPDTLIVIDGIILSAYNDNDDNIVLETNEGRTVLPKGPKYAIADEAGNGYIVDKDGKIQKTTATDALAAGAKADREYSTDPNLKISFLEGPNMNFGLDEPQTVLSQNYQQTENGERISWKALATGTTDKVIAAAQGEGDISKARFILGDDSQVLTPEITGTAGQQALSLLGKNDGRIEELLAYYPNADTTKDDVVAGKLNMVSYNLERRNLILIKVNGTDSPDHLTLQNQLNDIYLQGVVNWTVKPTESITVSGINESSLDDGGSGLTSNYTEDMNKVIRAYLKNHTLENDTYYLFLVKKASSGSKLGYMPRKKQAGFIFVEPHGKDPLLNTIAHELGHGAFRLKHTFSEYPALSQGITQNLMDYPAQSRLDKWQWDYIHNPEAVLGLFEDDDEGALVYDCPKWFSGECEDVGKILDLIKDLVAKGKNLEVQGPFVAERRELIANNIELDGVLFKKLQITNLVETGDRIICNPIEFKDYNQKYLTVQGTEDSQKGFIFRAKGITGIKDDIGKDVFKILIYEDDIDFSERKTHLKNYLFGGLNEQFITLMTKIREAKLTNKTNFDLSPFSNLTTGQTKATITKFKLNDYEIDEMQLVINNESKKVISIENAIISFTNTEGNQFAVLKFNEEDGNNPTIEITFKAKDRYFMEWYLLNKKPKLKITVTKTEGDGNMTLSSFNVNGGSLLGYFLERPSGTAAQERTSGSYKRIPAGTYSMCYPYKSCRPVTTRSNAENETWVKTNGHMDNTGSVITRDYILIHIGNYPWNSAGCLLIGDSYQNYTLDKDYFENETGKTYSKDMVVKMVTSSGDKLTALNNKYKDLIDLTKKFDESCKNEKCYELEIEISR